MFPYIMIVSTLIFFDAHLHHKFLAFISRMFRIRKAVFDNGKTLLADTSLKGTFIRTLILVFFLSQFLIPLRSKLYPGHLFWTEQGYRFSWRVMLMEKTGYANFKIVNSETGHRFYVNNTDFLNSFQEKQMSTQPDFILEYAHHLGHHFENDGHENVQVFVESHVALNGRGSRPYIDPNIDLMTVKESFKHKDWILDYYE